MPRVSGAAASRVVLRVLMASISTREAPATARPGSPWPADGGGPLGQWRACCTTATKRRRCWPRCCIAAHRARHAHLRPAREADRLRPDARRGRLHRPSYHLPAFTGDLAQRAADAADRRTWREVTDTSRHFFKRAAHPRTGLMPEYAYFDGRPTRPPTMARARRTSATTPGASLGNVAIDHQWWRADAEWQMAQSQRVVGFLSANPKGSLFTLEGKALDEGRSRPGLWRCWRWLGRAAGCAPGQDLAQRLWDAPMPTGRYRYDGLLASWACCGPAGRFSPGAQRFNGALKGATQPSCSSACTPLRCVPGRAATAGWTAGGVCRT